MIDSNYSVDVLINDKPVRKFPFEGKIFVEARKGQEYSIRIKNNISNRILSVISVDGLDVLSGKSATENSNGYVINGYNSLNLDGFRISDDKVAKFVFDYKDTSYAASKKDGSEKNVGVIGVRLFEEKIKPVPEIKEIHHHWRKTHPWPYYDDLGTPVRPWPQWPQAPIIWCKSTTCGTLGDITYGTSTSDFTNCYNNMSTQDTGAKETLSCMNMMANDAPTQKLSEEKTRGFDMGTKYGNAKESKVIEVEFEKGILTMTKDIYYASRESLIQMGVPLGNEKQVSFPEPFEGSKYCIPPKNWQG